jgi:hypothetical protein
MQLLYRSCIVRVYIVCKDVVIWIIRESVNTFASRADTDHSVGAA